MVLNHCGCPSFLIPLKSLRLDTFAKAAWWLCTVLITGEAGFSFETRSKAADVAQLLQTVCARVLRHDEGIHQHVFMRCVHHIVDFCCGRKWTEQNCCKIGWWQTVP